MPMIFGAPLLLLLFAASALPWLLVFRARFGHLIAIPATAGGALFLLLVTLVISAPLHLNYVLAVIGAAVLTGLVGLAIARRTPGVLRRPSRYAVALWAPAMVGAAIWILTDICARAIPNASRFGWAQNGDSLNNLWDATQIIRSNGITLPPTQYGVPLSTALIALARGAGSPASDSASAELAHQLSAFTLVWVILLAVTCVAMGAVAASLIRPHLVHTVALVSALGSLLPLTWLVSGLLIQWGYFNISVILPIAFAAWLIYLGSPRHPVAALVSLTGLTTLALLTWTPVAFPIVALGVVIVIRNVRLFFALRGWSLAVVIVGIGQATAVVVAATVPSLIGSVTALAASGDGYLGFPNLWLGIPIIAVIAAATLLLVRSRTSLPVVSGLIAMASGSAVAMATVLYLSVPSGDEFGAYYPKKLVYILLIVFGLLALSFAIGAIGDRVRLSLIAIICVLAVLAAAVLPPGTWPETIQRQPVARILGDYVRHDGEQTVREILRFASDTHPTVLWQSGYPDEPIVNEWVVLSHGGLIHGDKKLIALVGGAYFLFRGSGRYSDRQVSTLCTILPRLPGSPIVRTANPRLGVELTKDCPGVRARVIVDTSLVGPLPSKTGENWETDGIEGPFH